MGKKLKKQKSGTFERTALFTLLLAFACVLGAGWIGALSLRDTIAAKNSIVNIDARAPIEVERIRNLALSKISDSRAYFLLNSRVLFDEQKKEQQTYREALTNFEKQFNLPGVSEIIRQLEKLDAQEQEVFEQALKFREKQTEAKIVGQFYQAKSLPLRTQINEALNSIVALHNGELDKARERAEVAAAGAEAQIPIGMAWFTGLAALLFLAMAMLILRLLGKQNRHFAERDRLFEAATKATNMRDEVMAAVVHDLKEPLQAINKATDELSAGADSAKIAENVEMIKSAAALTESLVRDIMDQAKSETGEMTLRLDQIGINDILSEARLVLQPLAKRKNLRLQIDVANPPVLGFFDRERILRVLSNLVGNAIKFTPTHGSVGVRVRSDQQFIYVSVTDSGPGIPSGKLPFIFDNFWQARKTAEQGPGIGLAVVKSIVTAHGGTVSVDSATGNGSTFTFTLPRRRPTGAVLKSPTTSVKAVTRTPTQTEVSANP